MRQTILILIVFSTLLSISCGEEVLTEVEPEIYSWDELDELLPTEKYLLNSTVAEDQLSIFTPELLITVDSTNQISQRILGVTWDMKSIKPAMENGFYFAMDERNPYTLDIGAFQLGYFNLYGSGYNYLTISLEDYDSTYSWITEKNVTRSQEYGTFGNNQFLIDYQTNEYPNKISFILLSYDFRPGEQALSDPFNFQLTNSELIEIEAFNSFGNSNSFYCEGKFYISISSSGLYQLQGSQPIKCVNIDNASTMFSYRNEMYAVSNRTILKSNDGLIWQEIATFNTHLDYSNFAIIEDQIILSVNDQLFQVSFDSDELEILEIENAGLDGNFITSIKELGGRIYCTTLSGLFYADLDNFFTYKTE